MYVILQQDSDSGEDAASYSSSVCQPEHPTVLYCTTGVIAFRNYPVCTVCTRVFVYTGVSMARTESESVFVTNGEA